MKNIPARRGAAHGFHRWTPLRKIKKVFKCACRGQHGILGETGARSNALQIAGQNLTALKLNLTTYRSSLQDVDIEEAVTSMVTKQTAYQAAMMATSKVLGMTLTDYLR